MHLATSTLGAIMLAINLVAAIHETAFDESQNEIEMPPGSLPDITVGTPSGVQNLIKTNAEVTSKNGNIDTKAPKTSPDTFEAFKKLIDLFIGASPVNSPSETTIKENPSSTEKSSEKDISLLSTQTTEIDNEKHEEVTLDIESVPLVNPLEVKYPVKIKEFVKKEPDQETKATVKVLPNLSNDVNSDNESIDIPTTFNVEEFGPKTNIPEPDEDFSNQVYSSYFKISSEKDNEKPLVIKSTPAKTFEIDNSDPEKETVILANLSNEINAALSDVTQSLQERNPEAAQNPIEDAVETNVPESSSQVNKGHVESSSVSNLGNIPCESSQTKLNDIEESKDGNIDSNAPEVSPDAETFEAFKELIDQFIETSPASSPSETIRVDNPSSTENSSENGTSPVTTQNALTTGIAHEWIGEETWDLDIIFPIANIVHMALHWFCLI